MAKSSDLHKPGEKAVEGGTYYCWLCAQLGLESTCTLQAGQLFTGCARCLERGVAEWDLTWRSQASRGRAAKGGGSTTRWPGSLGPDS
jgi:hypothetical protein